MSRWLQSEGIVALRTPVSWIGMRQVVWLWTHTPDVFFFGARAEDCGNGADSLDIEGWSVLYARMTNDQLKALAALLPLTADDTGWLHPPENRMLNVHASHDGVPLSMGRTEAIKVDGDLLRARNSKGEIYVLMLADLFAVAMDAPSAGGRKAGFAAGG